MDLGPAKPKFLKLEFLSYLLTFSDIPWVPNRDSTRAEEYRTLVEPSGTRVEPVSNLNFVSSPI